MPRTIDLTGEVFGQLRPLYKSGKAKDGSTIWRCSCTCGNECDVPVTELRRGRTKSCGCYRHTNMSIHKRATKHGRSGNNTFNAWSRLSGDRVPRWDDFQLFLEDMGEHPGKGTELLKIDPLEPHGPENSYYRLRGEKRLYPNLPWMAVDFAELERVAREATRNREGTTYACFRSKYQA